MIVAKETGSIFIHIQSHHWCSLTRHWPSLKQNLTMANCSLGFGAYSPYYYVTLRYVTFHALRALLFTPGFYLGYLRGRSFPPKKIIVIITVYKWLYRKNHPDATRLVHTLEHFSKLYQNAPDCISVHIISKHFRGGMPPDPLWKPLAFSQSGLFPQMINPR